MHWCCLVTLTGFLREATLPGLRVAGGIQMIAGGKTRASHCLAAGNVCQLQAHVLANQKAIPDHKRRSSRDPPPSETPPSKGLPAFQTAPPDGTKR